MPPTVGFGYGGEGRGFGPEKKLADAAIAREASKRIVEDLLLTAGGNVTDELEEAEDSPSVVRRTGAPDEDTF